MRLRTFLAALLVATAGALIVAWDGLLTPAFTDYEAEAEPAFNLLRAGHLDGFLTHAPSYGGSLILRAPFVFAVTLWHAGGDAAFRASAVPAIIASIVLSLVLFGRLRGPGAWLALLLCAANPLTLASFEIGHPEELLGGVLCVGAMLCALADRPLWAGVMVGLAIANKPWATLAVAPVLLALDHGRIRALLGAGAACAVVLAPLLLAGGHSLGAAAASAHQTGAIFQPHQIWWFFGATGHVIIGSTGVKHGFRAGPTWVATIAHPLVILAGLGLSVAWWRLRARGADRRDALGLLALVMFVRCVIDPWNVVYYELPFVLALLAWEVELGRVPLVALVATCLTWASFELTLQVVMPDAQSAFFLLWAVPMCAGLGLRVFAPARWARLIAPLSGGLRRRLPTLAAAITPRRVARPI
jgi:hypothetical protein